MPIRIDDAAVFRMVSSVIEIAVTAFPGAHAFRRMSDPVDDITTLPAVEVRIQRIEIGSASRQNADDQDRASLEIEVHCMVGGAQTSDYAVASLASATTAALFNLNAVDSGTLGGTNTDHRFTINAVARQYIGGQADDQRLMIGRVVATGMVYRTAGDTRQNNITSPPPPP